MLNGMINISDLIFFNDQNLAVKKYLLERENKINVYTRAKYTKNKSFHKHYPIIIFFERKNEKGFLYSQKLLSVVGFRHVSASLIMTPPIVILPYWRDWELSKNEWKNGRMGEI
jgi:hypothetical protein